MNNDDPPCKRNGCGHALSLHNLSLAEKRAQLEGTIVLDEFLARNREFNIESGTSKSSCSESGCNCLAFRSPYA
jgi:hypothetical protein